MKVREAYPFEDFSYYTAWGFDTMLRLTISKLHICTLRLLDTWFCLRTTAGCSLQGIYRVLGGKQLCSEQS